MAMYESCSKKEKDAKEAEIEEIQSCYPGRCEVIFDSDPPCTLVLVQPVEESSTIIELQFGLEYPDEVPVVSVTSKSLSKSDTKSLQVLLDEKTSQLAGHLMAMKLLGTSEEFLKTCVSSQGTIKNERGNRSNKKKGKGERQHDTHTVEMLSDDQIQISKGKKGKRSRRKARYSSDSDGDVSDLYAENGLSPFGVADNSSVSNNTLCPGDSVQIEMRPTHFIAVRITHADIRESLTRIQKVLVEKEPLLSKGTFTPEMLHVTLCAVGLDTETEVSQCISALDGMRSDLTHALPRTPLTVHGMAQFYNRAIYAKVTHGDDFLHFHSTLRTKLREHNVDIRDEHEGYSPHVTIVKVKRPERRLFGSRNIRPSIYSDFLDVVHGHQAIDALYLCAMDGQRREDGFYTTLHELHL
ncbi:uncharacterized protein LOC106012638 [Aplysia californica]|uniref:Uncharacterized protein LOC106012638 n=1 Tax=Aplysia californica TaxID=6500 RepID=A0ABM1A694_APLCA|nr:uncharacterized protein LOC106012638 [Aplysia californica]